MVLPFWASVYASIGMQFDSMAALVQGSLSQTRRKQINEQTETLWQGAQRGINQQVIENLFWAEEYERTNLEGHDFFV